MITTTESKALIGRCPGCGLIVAASFRPDRKTAREWMKDGMIVTLVEKPDGKPAFSREEWVESRHSFKACVAKKAEAMFPETTT